MTKKNELKEYIDKITKFWNDNNQKLEQIKVTIPPPGPNSLLCLNAMQKSIGRTSYCGLYGITIISGDRYYIKDADNNIYIDFLGGASANNLGYNTGLEKEYSTQAKVMQHNCLAYSPNFPAIKLADKLIEITPGDFEKRVMFGMSGSDACGGAIEAMRKYTGKYKLISFLYDWHGSTGLSQPASGFESLNDGIYEPEKDYFIHLDYPKSQNDAQIILDKIDTLFSNDDQIGGILFEAIQGDAGVNVPPKNFIKNMAEIVHKHKGLVMVDEVQSGMGRTGQWWAIQHEDVEPDLLMSAKGLSAGYAPISAVIGREEIINSLTAGQELFTYGSHAPSTAVALAVIEKIENDNLLVNAEKMGTIILNKLSALQKKHPTVIKEIRGRGLMIGMEIFDYYYDKDKKNYPGGAVFSTRAVEKGIYFGVFGPDKNVVRIEPALNLDEKAINFMLSTAEEVALEIHSHTIPERTIENINKYTIGI